MLYVRCALVFVFISSSMLFGQTLRLQEKAPMPMAISNNAVAAAKVGGVPYVYSFSGIDSTKIFSGISLKSFRYNTQTDVWDTIASLPDVQGKIAAGASTVKNKIYIIGGYSVSANGTETSSDKVHIYNPQTNSYEPDGAPIPIPIDDHVQAVYKDSLIYVVTGWSNTNNRNTVQIYDPAKDVWQVGTALPNNDRYTSFGASGMILNDTIFYFGGASARAGFPIQNNLRYGSIDATDPTQIIWKDTIIAPSIVGYRMAAIVIERRLNWLGGSNQTYNYDGLAYGSGQGVPPNNRRLVVNAATFAFDEDTSVSVPFPMDLRGIACTDTNEFYLVGGMENNQQVSDKTIMIRYVDLFNLREPLKREFSIFPNPAGNTLNFSKVYTGKVRILSADGKVLLEDEVVKRNSFDLSQLPSGSYILEVAEGRVSFIKA